MRCVALAEEFAARGFAVTFVADVGAVRFAVDTLDARGFAHLAPPTSYPELLATLQPTVVVIDSYTLPLSVYADLRADFLTVALVDGDPGGREATILLDQNIGAEDDDWPLPEGVTRLAGLRHALMRNEILDARPDTDHLEATPARVLAFFGGTDAMGAAPVLTRALLATTADFDLRVVGATEQLREKLAEFDDPRVTVLEPTSEIAAEIVAADLVIGAAGASSWELLCLGAACAFVCVADNQRTSYTRITELGAVIGLGELDAIRADPTGAERALKAVLTDADERARLRSTGRNLVDGAGRARVADTVLASRTQPEVHH